MITLFTTTKPFHGLAATHQTNALGSWAQLQPPPTVVVFGTEDGTGTVCQRLRLNHVPTVPSDEYGLPMLSFMFLVAQEFSDTEFVCYANADIIILDGLTDAARQVDECFPAGFLGVCRRWDIDLDEPLDFEADWQGTVHERIQHGQLYTPCSSDMFLFKKPLPWHLPPFTVGRPRWDNWMLWAACEHHLPVVDLTGAVTLAHARHGYGADGRTAQWTAWKHESSDRNKKLSEGKVFCLKHVSKTGNLWALVDGEVRQA